MARGGSEINCLDPISMRKNDPKALQAAEKDVMLHTFGVQVAG